MSIDDTIRDTMHTLIRDLLDATKAPQRLAVTMDEAGEMLGVSRTQIRAWIDEGRLRILPMERGVRVCTVDIQELAHWPIMPTLHEPPTGTLEAAS